MTSVRAAPGDPLIVPVLARQDGVLLRAETVRDDPIVDPRPDGTVRRVMVVLRVVMALRVVTEEALLRAMVLRVVTAQLLVETAPLAMDGHLGQALRVVTVLHPGVTVPQPGVTVRRLETAHLVGTVLRSAVVPRLAVEAVFARARPFGPGAPPATADLCGLAVRRLATIVVLRETMTRLRATMTRSSPKRWKRSSSTRLRAANSEPSAKTTPIGSLGT